MMSKYDHGQKWFEKKKRKRDRLLVTNKPWIGDGLPAYRSAKAAQVIGKTDRVRVVGRKT